MMPNQGHEAIASELHEAARTLAGTSRVVAFTGAGISAPSGIPTFREGGLWDRYSPDRYGTPWGLRRIAAEEPDELLAALLAFGRTLLAARPNAAHHVLANWEARGRLRGVVTQNVDDLHERAGTQRIAKLHGDLGRWRCIACGEPAPTAPDREALLELLEAATTLETVLAGLPRCPCGAWLRPEVVLFGELLPQREVVAAEALLAEAEVVLAIGTSGVVEPAAGMLRAALRRGARLVEVNPMTSALTPLATVRLANSADEALAALDRLLEAEA